MRKWNASMPREKAPAGEAYVVLAYRKSCGLRMEFEGKLTAENAQKLMLYAIEMMNASKEPSHVQA